MHVHDDAATLDHPLADAAIRAALIRDLPPQPALVIERLSMYLESLPGDVAGLAALADAIEVIDEAAQPQFQPLLRDFLALAPQPARAAALWQSVTRFLTLDLAVLGALLNAPAHGARGVGVLKPRLPGIALRTVRNCARLVKWRALRYGPQDTLPWRPAAFALVLAKRCDFLRTPLSPYARLRYESTVELAWKRLVAFAASSPTSLALEQVDALDRLIGRLAHRFTIERRPAQGTHYWVDLAHPKAPARYTRALDPRSGLRFIGGLEILPELDSIETALGRGASVAGVLGADMALDAHDVAALIAHLRSHWALPAARRKHPHRAIRTPLDVVRGFDDVLDVLVAGETAHAGGARPTPAMHRWTTLNVSAGGFAALVAPADAPPAAVGELVAVRTQGTPAWRVGMVRRLDTTDASVVFVAVEMLQGRTAAIELRAPPPDGDASAPQEMQHPTVAIVAGEPRPGGDVFVAWRGAGIAMAPLCVPESDQGALALLPQRLLRRGPDYDLVHCRVAAG